MTSMPDTLSDKNNDEKKTGLTPRQLIHRHIEHPEEPITDEDISNLRLHEKLTPTDEEECIALTAEETEALEKRAINPLDMLGA